MDSNVRNRFDALRFVMIAGVVLLHTPEYVPVTDIGSDWFSLVKSFFQNALFRTTVPVLTCISGYLVFQAGLDRVPATLLAKKSRSLLLPFLAFNLPVLLGAWLASSYGGLQLSYDLGADDPAIWRDAAFGLLRSPINYPLNFLRDMMALMLIAPLLGILIRQVPYLGLALCVVFFLNNLDGPLVLRDTMPLAFYLGGLAACRNWNLRALDAYAWPCLAAFLLLCASVVYFRTANTTVLRLLSPLLVWPASALLGGSRFGNWCAAMNKYSFFIFVAHAPVLLASWQAYKRLGTDIPYPLYWACAPLLVCAILVAAYRLGMRVAPGTLQFLLGGRNRKKAQRSHEEGACALSAAVAPAHVRARVPYRPDGR